MRLDRVSNGERVSGVSAILLFALMFFHWFGSKDSGELQLFSVGRSAWEALEYIPIVLTVTIVAALAVVTLRLADVVRKSLAPFNALVAVLGLTSALLILFRAVDPPNFGSFREVWGNITIEGTVQFPIFLALLSATGIAVGGFLAMHEEGISLSDLLRQLRHRD